jgi:hypothetical protein
LDQDCDPRIDEMPPACSIPPGATAASCRAGACAVDVCVAGRGDCNGTFLDGCETDLDVPLHCGACDTGCGLASCSTSRTCSPPPFARGSAAGGGAGRDEVVAVATDASGVTCIAGTYDAAATFLGVLPTFGGTDVFVACYMGSTLTPLWANGYGGPGDDAVGGVAIVGTTVFVAGTFAASISFDALGLGAFGGAMYVAGLRTADGAPFFARQYGDGGGVEVHDVAASSTSFFVAGSFTAATSFGMGTATPTGGGDGFAAAYTTSTGMPRWQRPITGTGIEVATSVAVRSPGGEVLVGGRFDGMLTITPPRTTAGGTDGFVSWLNATSGMVMGSSYYGGLGEESVEELASGPSSPLVACAGTFDTMFTVGARTLIPVGGTDVFVSLLDPVGLPMDPWSYGGPGDDDVTGIAMDDLRGGVYAVGTFPSGSITFGGPGGDVVLGTAATNGYAVAMEMPTGRARWEARIGGPGDLAPADVAARTVSIAIGGWFTGGTNFGAGPVTSAGDRDAFLMTAEDP